MSDLEPRVRATEVAQARMDERFTNMATKVDAIHDAVVGNGHAGLGSRVRTLEGQARTRSRLSWAAFTAVLALVADRVKYWAGGGH